MSAKPRLYIICSFFISRVLFSKWILLPFTIHFVHWGCVYTYDYLYPKIPQLTGVHLLPDRERWCVMDNVIQPTSEIGKDRITLILHMSAEYLNDDITEQFLNWNGPIALSIVLNDLNQFTCAHRFMQSLIDRHGITMIQVHFIYKKDHIGRCHIADGMKHNETLCSNGATKRSTVDVADYPMNMARNVARQFIRTEFLLLSDVDLLFSDGFERRMSQAARRELLVGSKKVLVFRIFEVYNQFSAPRTKMELTKLLNRKEADVFHVRAAFGAHELDGRFEWLSRPENFTYTNVVPGPIRYSRFTWEPRFVGRASVPLHDEAFPYRIRANNVLGWEMCRAEYEFSLVEDLFTFHRAKRINDFTRQNENHLVQLMNRRKYELALAEWRRRMDCEYPETKGSCPAILRKRKWIYTEE